MIENHGFPKPSSNEPKIPAFLFNRLREWMSARESNTLWIASENCPEISNTGTLALSYLLPLLFPATNVLLAYKCNSDNMDIEMNKMVYSLHQQVVQQSGDNAFQGYVTPFEGSASDTFESGILSLERILQDCIKSESYMMIGIFDGFNRIDRKDSTSLSQFFQMLQRLQQRKNLKLLFATCGPCRILQDAIAGSKTSVYSSSIFDYNLRSLDRAVPKPISKLPAPKLQYDQDLAHGSRCQLFDARSAGHNFEAIDRAKSWLSSHRKLLQNLERASPGWVPPTSPTRAKIAILDTGLDGNTPLLGSRSKDRLEYHSFLKEDKEKPKAMYDTSGHGTYVASLLDRIYPYAKLYIFRVTKDDTWTSENEQNVVNAINEAAKQGVEIISMSFGFPKQIDCIAEAIESYAKDILFFAAASNGGANIDIAYPASGEEVICITSSDGDGNWSKFNPNGDEVNKGYSTLGEAVEFDFPVASQKTKVQSGTSFATPIAAGIAGLLIHFCAYYFNDLSLDDGGKLMKRLKKKKGMQKTLDLLTKNERSGTVRYLYPPKKFPIELVSREAALERYKQIACEIASVLDSI